MTAARRTSHLVYVLMTISASSVMGQEVHPLANGKVGSVVMSAPFKVALGVDSVSSRGMPSVLSLSQSAWLLADADGKLHLLRQSRGELATRIVATDPGLRVGTMLLGSTADTVFVVHGNGRAFSSVSTKTWVLSSGAALPWRVISGTLLRGGEFAFNILANTPEHFGIPMVLWAGSRTNPIFFGERGEPSVVFDPARQWRVLAASSNGGVWVCSPTERSAVLWDSGGSVRRVLGLSAVATDSTGRLGPSDAYITAMREDTNGRLWVILHVRPSKRQAGSRAAAGAQRLRSAIQVFDANSGRLLFEKIFDKYLMGLPGDYQAAEFDVESGMRYVTLWQLRLTEGRDN